MRTRIFPALVLLAAPWAQAQTPQQPPAAAQAPQEVVVKATKLPVSADLEQGYGDAPKIVAQTIVMAGEIALAGCSNSGAARSAISVSGSASSSGGWPGRRASPISSS